MAETQAMGDTINEVNSTIENTGYEDGITENDENSSMNVDEYDENDSQDLLTLETLPTELLLHICSFLDAKFVIRTLGCVCKYFHSVVNDNTFWKIRIGKRWPKKYPALPVNDAVFDWKNACISREEQSRLWGSEAANMQFFKYTKGLYSSVDAVHLMQKGSLVAAGSRDRYLNILDLSKLTDDPNSINEADLHQKLNAHRGWIWTIKSLNNVVVTGSWDTHIKLWDLNAGLEETTSMKADSAVLDMHYEENILYCGGYDKHVYHMDPRTSTVIKKVAYHKRPVLCLRADDNFVLSGSEDCTVVVYDRRADKVFKRLRFAEYPMCMSYGNDQLWVGDKEGKVHLIDPSDGDFDIVQTYDVGHTGKITSVIHTMGAIFTSSSDKTIKVLEPSLNPGTISTLPEQGAEVAGLAYANDILASAGSDISIGIYVPKSVLPTDGVER